MNTKMQNMNTWGEKAEGIINVLPPQARAWVAVLSSGAFLFLSFSEACKSATTFAKEGLPQIVDNLNIGINMLKSGHPNVIVEEICDTQIISESSEA